MVRVGYNLQCTKLQWLLYMKRLNRVGRFEAFPSQRDVYFSYTRRVAKWNKHTVGTE